jgi:hypothetical protein
MTSSCLYLDYKNRLKLLKRFQIMCTRPTISFINTVYVDDTFEKYFPVIQAMCIQAYSTERVTNGRTDAKKQSKWEILNETVRKFAILPFVT